MRRIPILEIEIHFQEDKSYLNTKTYTDDRGWYGLFRFLWITHLDHT
jgi:hypothetical protein